MKTLLVAILSLLPNYVFMEDLWHHADWSAGAAVASRGRGGGIDHNLHDIEVCTYLTLQMRTKVCKFLNKHTHTIVLIFKQLPIHNVSILV